MLACLWMVSGIQAQQAGRDHVDIAVSADSAGWQVRMHYRLSAPARLLAPRFEGAEPVDLRIATGGGAPQPIDPRTGRATIELLEPIESSEPVMLVYRVPAGAARVALFTPDRPWSGGVESVTIDLSIPAASGLTFPRAGSSDRLDHLPAFLRFTASTDAPPGAAWDIVVVLTAVLGTAGWLAGQSRARRRDGG